MGCIHSKRASRKSSRLQRSRSRSRSHSPAPYIYSVASVADRDNNINLILEPEAHSGILILENKGDGKSTSSAEDKSREAKRKSKTSSSTKASFGLKLGLSVRHTQAEQNAAGWPSWLTSVASEAIHGWVPLRADAYEKLEKVGQGTYSSVFRAREVETGRMVALKKVRFDTFQPESIRFMAREITILRRLDHPNVMKLEGLITSRLSNSIYFVFDYMEHDLAGLVSNPEITFTESQVKCYMRQLLSGIEHCHLRGIMHRDIKTSNILVNNDGVLKIGDFGLANTLSTNNKQPLTSRVVTLWYRPPELLMGATNYNVSVDLWSVGCVFAELYLGKPILKGRTEVEQLHKIFKLCGSPPDDFWKKSRLPHAMFKPQSHYENSITERCRDFPETAVNLIEVFLSIEPSQRGTASSALMSEYFRTKPYACDPSSLPKYPPNKEIDAKIRDDVLRKRAGIKTREAGPARKPVRAHKVSQEKNSNRAASKEEIHSGHSSRRDSIRSHGVTKGRSGASMRKELLKQPFDVVSDIAQINGNHGYGMYDGSTGGFSWANNGVADASSVLSDGSKSKVSALDPSFAKGTYKIQKKMYKADKNTSPPVQMQQRRSGQPMDILDYQGIDVEYQDREPMDILDYDEGYYKSPTEMMETSCTMVHRNDLEEMLQENGSQAYRKSRFEREI